MNGGFNKQQYDFINDVLGGVQGHQVNKLKDRMRTTILKAKQYDRQKFTELLAADYIKISKEL